MISSTARKFTKTIYVTAGGLSARSFLKPHFRALSDDGFEVLLASSDDTEAKQATADTGIRHLPVEIAADISPFSDLGSIARLIIILRAERPEVVHAHMSKAGLISMCSAFVTRVPHRLYHNHGMAFFSSSGFKKRILSACEKLTCALATQVIFCSKSTMQAAINEGLCPAEKALMLGKGSISGIDTERFSGKLSAEDAQKMRDHLKLSGKPKIVGFVGRIVRHKGVDNLLNAWRLTRASRRNGTVLLICGKHDEDELFDQVRLASAELGNVVYVDRQDAIDQIYSMMDIMVLPSLHEGLPYSVLEAQSSGVTAIVTNVTGNSDSVVSGKTGIIVEPKDSYTLAHAIDNLLDDEALRKQMGEQAAQRIRKNYSQTIVIDNLKKFYRELRDTHPSR